MPFKNVVFSGICFVQPEGIFESQQLLALFIFALLVAFTLIIVLLVHGCRRSAAVGKKRIVGDGAQNAQEYGLSAASTPLSPGCVAKNMPQTFEMPFFCVSSSKFTDCLTVSMGIAAAVARQMRPQHRRAVPVELLNAEVPMELCMTRNSRFCCPHRHQLTARHRLYNPFRFMLASTRHNRAQHLHWPLTSSTPSPIQFTGSGQLVRLNFGGELSWTFFL